MPDLVDANGQPLKKPTAPPVGEAASILLSTYAVFGGLLQPDDATLASRGGGRGYAIYRDIERDAHAWAVLDKRKRAVIARPVTVTPASESARDKAAAALVEDQVKRLPFDRLCYELLDATLIGFAVSEILWEVGQEVRAAAAIPRGQDRFKFDTENRLRLLTRSNSAIGEPMPEYKFIVHRHGGTDNTPYGLGLGTRLFWPVFFKRQDITFWLTWLDKYGSPMPLGKYPSNATPAEKDTLLRAAIAIRQEAAAIIPEGMLLELLEAKGGSTDAYERLARYMDEQISLIVLGETMTTTAAGAGLGSSQADVHNDVRIELAQADADLLNDTLNQTLVRWIVDFNDPGAGYPKIGRDFSEPEDLTAKANRDKTLSEMGLEPDDAYLTENWPGWRRKAPTLPASGSLPPEGAAPGLGAAQRPGGAPMPAFAAGSDQPARDALDDLVDAAAADWQPAMEAMLAPVQALLAAAEKDGLTLTQVRDRLPALVGQGASRLEDSLSKTLLTARAAGEAGVDTHGDLS